MSEEHCREIFELISQYLDGELPEDLQRQIDAHIAGCGPCIKFLESLRKSRDLCRSFQPENLPGPLPPGLREALMAAYLKHRTPHP